MAGVKFSIVEREEVYQRVTRMYLEGVRNQDIAKDIGVSIPQVTYYIKRLKKEFAARRPDPIAVMIEERRDQIKSIRVEAWRAYRLSIADKQRETTEAWETDDKDDEDAKKSIAKLKRIITKEGRLPANEYLQTMIQTLKMESELDGLEAPKKVDATITIWDALAKGEAVQVADLDGEIERQLCLPAPPVEEAPAEVGWYEQIKPQ